MGKLNVALMKYLSKEDYRLLTAVEMGMKNHELVPDVLVCSIANMKRGGIAKQLRDLVQHKLLVYEASKSLKGYRLTNQGYDYLALNTLCMRGTVASFGNMIGVGKESDVYVARNTEEVDIILKLHRLGRTSFRRVREKRDYHRSRRAMSWIYLSRLAAAKEYAFMKALHVRDFPVPKPYDFNRHCVAMELINGFPLCQVQEVGNVEQLFSDICNMLVRLAEHGLIHGDFNEFNIIVTEHAQMPVLIDFPQMVSTSHKNAQWYFDRDVVCIRDFFKRRFNFESEECPKFEDVVVEVDLDREVMASGFVTDVTGGDQGDSEESEDNDDDTDDDEGTDHDDDAEASTSSMELKEDDVVHQPSSTAESDNDGPRALPKAAYINDADSDDDVPTLVSVRTTTTQSTIPPSVIKQRLRMQHHKRNQRLQKKDLKTGRTNKEKHSEIKELKSWTGEL